MPPIRSHGRAPKACDLCRKYKTRCHILNSSGGPCLRCQTLSYSCSLETSGYSSNVSWPASSSPQTATARDGANASASDPDTVGQRLHRLESLVSSLETRLDAKLDALIDDKATRQRHHAYTPTQAVAAPAASAAPASGSNARSHSESVPVFFIRDAATDAGVHSPEAAVAGVQPDVISSGIVPVATALSLLQLFRVHYGRWVRFHEDVSIEILLTRVRKSPLFLASILLIAVRHTSQDLADQLAPRLFQEAKRLLMPSLLEVPQPIEYFQATIVLSLWSTTIGQTPLSIDSWLLTTYAISQGLASPVFAKVLHGQSDPSSPSMVGHVDAWCIWNHLCVAHLQYCVGTRRRAALSQRDVDNCSRLVEADDVSNYEARMAAEINLYWAIYQNCTISQVPIADAKLSLENWKQEWTALFRQPRSQFLQMGYHFAYLLIYRQSLKEPEASMDGTVLQTMIYHAKSAIVLAINTTDERTRHLTDHIYHILTFAALTICQLVQAYEPQLAVADVDLPTLEKIIVEFIDWLQSIGLPCHAAHILGDIVSAQFNKVRGAFRRRGAAQVYDAVADNARLSGVDLQFQSNMDFTFLYPDFIGSELFDTGSQPAWPQWS